MAKSSRPTQPLQTRDARVVLRDEHDFQELPFAREKLNRFGFGASPLEPQAEPPYIRSRVFSHRETLNPHLKLAATEALDRPEKHMNGFHEAAPRNRRA
jgi:hypothetical protein